MSKYGYTSQAEIEALRQSTAAKVARMDAEAEQKRRDSAAFARFCGMAGPVIRPVE